MAGRVLEKLSTQATNSVTELRSCITNDDAEQLARVAHGLKGAAGAAFGQIAAETSSQLGLEQISQANEMDHADECLSRLQGEVRRCNEFMAQAMNQLIKCR